MQDKQAGHVHIVHFVNDEQNTRAQIMEKMRRPTERIPLNINNNNRLRLIDIIAVSMREPVRAIGRHDLAPKDLSSELTIVRMSESSSSSSFCVLWLKVYSFLELRDADLVLRV